MPAVLSFLTACTFAASVWAQMPAVTLPKEVAQPDQLPPLASYSAVYELSLSRAAQLEGVRAATGKMLYTIVDRCDGYTVESDLEANLSFSNGVSNQVLKRFAGWESKDGRRATFRMQIYENGALEDAYRGNVELKADGSGRAVYIGDETTVYDLPSGTILSTTQLRDLVRAAQDTDSIVNQTIMDGAFEDGPYRVSGYIAHPKNMTEVNAEAPAEARSPADAALLAGSHWPVALAYFSLDPVAELPEYEANLQLLPNGVIRSMTQDYSTYTLSLDLTKISAREGGCP